jgi:hypothetical protein
MIKVSGSPWGALSVKEAHRDDGALKNKVAGALSVKEAHRDDGALKVKVAGIIRGA